MIQSMNFEECEISVHRLEDGVIIKLKVVDGKFSRLASFKLTDYERIRFATELLELT